MAKKAVIKKQIEPQQEPEKENKGFFGYLRFGESYTSLILGIIVVIIATALLLSFVHNKNAGNVNTPISQDTKNNIEITQKMLDLEKTAPNLIVDNVLPTDTPAQVPTNQPTEQPTPTNKPQPTALPKPTVKPTKTPQPTVTQKPKEIAKKPEATKAPQKVKITSVPQVKTDKDNNVWTVQKGESLWSIAEKKYNSGYNWVDIARANNLSDPSSIHAGDKLKLPSVKSNEQTIATVKTDDEENSKTVQKITTQPEPTTKPAVKPNTVGTNQLVKITGNTYDVVRGDNLWNIAVRAYGDGYRWADIAKANGLTNPRVIHAGNHFTIPR